MNDKAAITEKKKSSSLLAGSGTIAGLFALIGASCCVLPLILVNIGVSTASVAKLAIFARAQPYFMGLSVLLIGAAFIASFWNGRRPSKKVLALLVISGLFVAAAYIMPFYEGQLLRWINFQ